MQLICTSQPSTEPITLAQAKAHLRQDGTDDDALITNLIIAARTHAETVCRRAFVTQTWKLVLDLFPTPAMNISSANWYGPQWGIGPGPLSVTAPAGQTGYEIYLPLPSLQTVGSINYIDQNGVQQTLDPTLYKVGTVSEPGRLTPAYAQTWPATRNEASAVEITYTCGYGAAAAVPAGIQSWMLLRLGALYENREEVLVGTRLVVADLTFVDRLLDPYRVLSF